MTKFNPDFMKEVQQYWKENKNRLNGKKVGGIHRKVTRDRKFTMHDLAEHFNLTFAQANRIAYVKKIEVKDES